MPSKKPAAKRPPMDNEWTDLESYKSPEATTLRAAFQAEKRTARRKKEEQQERREQQKPRKAGQATISLRLPLAYLRILQTEAGLLRIPRSQFLSLLVAQKCERLKIERPAHAPQYKFTKEEFEESGLFLWYCEPETRRIVDQDRKQMGLHSFGSWVNMVLNHWVGRPGGLQSDAWRQGE